jgi:hypothetical protein
LSPHSANIDRIKFEQYCGGNLARVQPDCAGEEELFERWNQRGMALLNRHPL